MTWIHQGKPFVDAPLAAAGFVYLLTDRQTGKQYIGKKSFWTTRRLPPLKGKTRRRVIKAESDWRDYCSSSETIKALVARDGAGRFHREILHLARNKQELNYLEMREQVLREVLLYPDLWYNGIISAKVGGRGLERLRV